MSPSPQAEQPDTEKSGRKRRRIALACEECRDRKRKCDGMRPVCGACSRRSGHACIWNDDRNNKGWTNNYVEGLRSRIRELEDAMGGAANAPLAPPELAYEQPGSPDHSRGTAPERAAPCLEDDFWGLPAGPASIQAQSPLRSGTVPAASPKASLPAEVPSMPSYTAPTPAMASISGRSERRARASGSTTNSPLQLNPDRDGQDPSDIAIDDADIDAMGVAGSIISGTRLRTRRPSEYFGPSSTFSLLGEACNVINERLYKNGRDASVDFSDEAVSVSSQPRTPDARKGPYNDETHILGLSVPPRAQADGLLDSYWTSVHSLYPFIHRPSFQKRYLSVWNPRVDQRKRSDGTHGDLIGFYDDLNEGLFHCLLNLVFALGALFDPSINLRDRESFSRSFFDRAKKLLDLDMLACGSLALVQTLLLMGQYLQSTESPSSCWNIIGLAIRVAQGIGLHHEPRCCRQAICPKGHSQMQMEMRRRTWTGCVLLDRVVSLTYGRPLMIYPNLNRKHFVLPAPIDDEYLSWSPNAPGKQPRGKISMAECYVQTVQLQDILGQVLAAFYNRGQDDQEAEPRAPGDHASNLAGKNKISDADLQMLLNVDGLLSEWHRKLPMHLKVQVYRNGDPSTFSSDPELTRLFGRQARVLETRFLHVRLTLLRPVFSVLCELARNSPVDAQEDSGELNMRQDMLVKAANLCVLVAQELIELIAGNTHTVWLQAPWYNILYLHSSAIVLLIGYLCSPRFITSIEETLLIAGWRRCLGLFRSYEPYHQSARRCRKTLELAEQLVLSQRNSDALGSQLNPKGIPAEEGQNPLATNAFLRPDPPQSDENFDPYLFHDCTTLNDASPAWMRDTSDMSWLSLVPFLDVQGSTDLQ